MDELYLALERYAADSELRNKCAKRAAEIIELLSVDKIVKQWEMYILSLVNGE